MKQTTDMNALQLNALLTKLPQYNLPHYRVEEKVGDPDTKIINQMSHRTTTWILDFGVGSAEKGTLKTQSTAVPEHLPPVSLFRTCFPLHHSSHGQFHSTDCCYHCPR